MKVLTHEGVLVTLPFTFKGLKDNEFERIDGKGGSAIGVVSEMSENDVRRLLHSASAIEENYLTPRNMMNDIKFIARSLLSVEDGAEIRMQKRGDRVSLLIPQRAQAAKAAVTVGARVAFNGRVSPKAAVNSRGTRREHSRRASDHKARRRRQTTADRIDGQGLSRVHSCVSRDPRRPRRRAKLTELVADHGTARPTGVSRGACAHPNISRAKGSFFMPFSRSGRYACGLGWTGGRWLGWRSRPQRPRRERDKCRAVPLGHRREPSPWHQNL